MKRKSDTAERHFLLSIILSINSDETLTAGWTMRTTPLVRTDLMDGSCLDGLRGSG